MVQEECIILLRDRFTFNGAIVSEKGHALTLREVWRDYCRNSDRLTLAALKELAAEVNSTIYWDDVFREMVRISENEFVNRKRIRFSVPDAEWLRFVSRNRIEDKDDSDADVVSGPVANDNTMPVLNLFFKGAYTESEALQRLLPQRLRDQFAFKTELAISCLSFKEAVAV